MSFRLNAPGYTSFKHASWTSNNASYTSRWALLNCPAIAYCLFLHTTTWLRISRHWLQMRKQCYQWINYLPIQPLLHVSFIKLNMSRIDIYKQWTCIARKWATFTKLSDKSATMRCFKTNIYTNTSNDCSKVNNLTIKLHKKIAKLWNMLQVQ